MQPMNMDQHDKVTKKLSERFLFLDFVMSVELLLSKNLKTGSNFSF